MEQNQSIKEMIMEDLAKCETIWKAYSHDWEELSALFFHLLHRYQDKIEGFDEGLCVIQDQEPSSESAAICRQNIQTLTERMQAFLDNNCSNEGLAEYYIRQEESTIDFQASFTSVRLALGMLSLSPTEMEEIMEKLSAMEEICAQVVPRSKKWDALREYLVWLSGKSAAIGMLILPLFFRINDKTTTRNTV